MSEWLVYYTKWAFLFQLHNVNKQLFLMRWWCLFCCEFCYDFHIKTMFVSSLPPVVCRRAHVLFTLCLFACSGVQHILCCVFVLFFFVLCALCCQFLWIVHIFLLFRYSLTFIFGLDQQVSWIFIMLAHWNNSK